MVTSIFIEFGFESDWRCHEPIMGYGLCPEGGYVFFRGIFFCGGLGLCRGSALVCSSTEGNGEDRNATFYPSLQYGGCGGRQLARSAGVVEVCAGVVPTPNGLHEAQLVEHQEEERPRENVMLRVLIERGPRFASRMLAAWPETHRCASELVRNDGDSPMFLRVVLVLSFCSCFRPTGFRCGCCSAP